MLVTSWRQTGSRQLSSWPCNNAAPFLYKIQDTRYRIQDTRYTIQGTRYKVRDTRYKIQDIQDKKYHRSSTRIYRCSGLTMYIDKYQVPIYSTFELVRRTSNVSIARLSSLSCSITRGGDPSLESYPACERIYVALQVLPFFFFLL